MIDGCWIGDTCPAARLLEDHGATWSAVVLTHPHLDHAPGLDQVLARPGAGLVGCADPRIDLARARPDPMDPVTDLDRASVEHVLSAIQTRWEATPEAEWRPRRGDVRAIGEATMRVLHPDEASLRSPNPNRRSTALLLEWNEVRLLLGADVVAEDWGEIASRSPELDLGAHSVLKVPHHASEGSRHASFGTGARERTWIVTPYSRGRKLPSFHDGGAVQWALSMVQFLHLTALPERRDLQGSVPRHATRAGLRDGSDPIPVTTTLPGGLTIEHVAEPAEPYSCFVAASFLPDGTLARLDHGAGSVVVTEA